MYQLGNLLNSSVDDTYSLAKQYEENEVESTQSHAIAGTRRGDCRRNVKGSNRCHERKGLKGGEN